MATISYIVPVYNNQGSIRKTWEGIRALYTTTMPQDDYEVIFVDDGSRDGSYAEMQEVSGEDPKVKLLRFTRNFGQVPAIIAGYEAAQGDAVINISADLQDPVDVGPGKRADLAEQFVAAEKQLAAADIRYMRQVFNRRKREEKASAKVEKKIRLKD